MMMVASGLLSLAAFAALALSLPRHHRDLLGTSPPPLRERVLRFYGWGLLCASLGPVIAGWGIGIGLASWCGVATVAGLAVSLLLAYRPCMMLPAGIASAPLALLCLFWSA